MATELTPAEEGALLRALFGSRNKAQFARDTEFPGGPSMISQHLSGHRPINLAAAFAYSRGLGVDIEAFSPRIAEQIRRISSISEEDGMLSFSSSGSRPGFASRANIAPGPDIRGQVPLISWVRAGELCESHDNYHPGDAGHWMDCPVPHGPRTYCLEISGESMDDGGPDAYRDGEIIFVDPDASADPGRDVVVRTPDNKTTFKRLKEDTEGRYLLGLNGKKIVRVPEDTVFCGVVIFSGRLR